MNGAGEGPISAQARRIEFGVGLAAGIMMLWLPIAAASNFVQLASVITGDFAGSDIDFKRATVHLLVSALSASVLAALFFASNRGDPPFHTRVFLVAGFAIATVSAVPLGGVIAFADSFRYQERPTPALGAGEGLLLIMVSAAPYVAALAYVLLWAKPAIPKRGAFITLAIISYELSVAYFPLTAFFGKCVLYAECR